MTEIERMIIIDEDTPLLVENIVSLARAKKVAVVKPTAQAIHDYREAYKRVYGILPEVKFDGSWYRIKGQTAGVKLKRLKEMTQQLNYRSGHYE